MKQELLLLRQLVGNGSAKKVMAFFAKDTEYCLMSAPERLCIVFCVRAYSIAQTHTQSEVPAMS